MTTPLPAPAGVPTDARGDYLAGVLGRPLTTEQQAAAAAGRDPLLVVAGAGSGKTAVMAARVVHLVLHEGLEPAAVLGLTFTAKAAGELATRVRRALASAGRADADPPTVSTYHAYAASILRDHALRIGREPHARLLTEAGRWQLAARVVRRWSGPLPALSAGVPMTTTRVLALDGELSEHLVDPAALRAHDARLLERLAAAPPSRALEEVGEALAQRADLLTLVEAYRAAKELAEVVDFGDQVALAALVAERAPEVGEGERARYAAVLLDEYQDTGVAQRRLLQALFAGGHPVTAVGDPHQGIYGWRGASVGNLARFPEHFPRGDGAPARGLALSVSFRCTGRVLDVANAVAAPLRHSGAAARRPAVQLEQLLPPPGGEEAGEVRVALHVDLEAEADWAAAAIADEVRSGTPPEECAVLCRRRADFGAHAAALLRHGLPVEVVGLGGLLELPEVADVAAVLRLLVDPLANVALVRLLAGSRWRIGHRDLAALGRHARRLVAGDEPAPTDGDVLADVAAQVQRRDPTEAVSLLDALEDHARVPCSAEAKARFAALSRELGGLRDLLGQPVVDVVAEVVRRTGLGVEVERRGAAALSGLSAFADHAARFVGVEGESDLAAFVAFLDAASVAEDGLDPGSVSAAPAVKVLTIHKAKGLEWDVVVVPGMSRGAFPSSRGRPRWTQRSEVLPHPLRGDADDLPVWGALDRKGLQAFAAACAEESGDEERRLAYVALTRARRLLLVSGAWWTGSGRATAAGPSPLLEEIQALGAPAVVVGPWEAKPEGGNTLAAAGDGPAWPVAPDAAAQALRDAAAARVRRLLGGGSLLGSGSLLDGGPLLDGGSLLDGGPPATDHGEPTPQDAGPPTGEPELELDPRERALVAAWDRDLPRIVAEAQRARAAERVVPLPRRLTASQLVLLAHDPDELARRLARPVPLPPQRAARRGTRFHAWVEQRAQAGPLLDLDDLPGRADDGAGAADDADLAALQEAFLAGPYGQRAPLQVEVPFELVLGGRLLAGRIDAVFADDDGGFDVVDWKTGAEPDDAQAAALQLSVYRLAWAGLAGVDPQRVRAAFVYVRRAQQVERPARLLDVDELTALLAGGWR